MTPLVRDAEGNLPEVVSSRIAERAPSSDGDEEVSVDSDVALAEVASPADLAGALRRPGRSCWDGGPGRSWGGVPSRC